MTPRTGRPTSNPKNVKLNLRITQDTANDLQECSEKLNVSRTRIIEKGIELVKSALEKK